MSKEDTRPLPDGWVKQFNEEHKTWFYINTRGANGPVSQWTHPADDAPPPHSYAAPTGPPPGSQDTKSSYPSEKTTEDREREQAGYSSQPAYNSNPSSSSIPQQQGGYAPSPQPQPQPAPKEGLGGFFDKFKNKPPPPGQYGQGYPGQGYQQQGMYPQQGMGYPQQQGMYGQQPMMGGGPMYGQQPMMGGPMYGRPQRQGMGAGGAAALGAGGGLMGGMLLGSMMSGGMGHNDGYQDGYQDGFEDGGDFDGGGDF